MAEDPAWTYLDSQHKWIMGQMNKAYEAGLRAVNCLSIFLASCHLLVFIFATATLENTATDESDPETLPNLLASQLHMSLIALEKKQADAIVGTLSSTPLR